MEDIRVLKKQIELHDVPDRFMVWVMNDEYSEIIARQYALELCRLWDLDLKVIYGVDEIPDDSFIEDTNLYVIKVDKWTSDFKRDNCIVICNSGDGIKFPKLEDWMLVDLALSKLKGINKQDIEWLITIYNGNYWRFLNDIDKIAIFDDGSQSLMFNQMVDDHQFDMLSSITIWDLSNSILKKDLKTIKSVLRVIEYIDIDPLGLTKVLLNNFRNILNIQLNPMCKAKDVNMSDKQFYVTKKYNIGYYNRDQLIKIMEVLTNIEYMFKYGELPLSLVIDYLVCEILGA